MLSLLLHFKQPKPTRCLKKQCESSEDSDGQREVVFRAEEERQEGLQPTFDFPLFEVAKKNAFRPTMVSVANEDEVKLLSAQPSQYFDSSPLVKFKHWRQYLENLVCNASEMKRKKGE
ncbi:unnamed protein product [Soboliphyme baturini]|uniref:BSD domain-containing protein n=1 Tax=Soboliphyme baturini TaxID=241478 RepID=A0A183IBV3_9BILA|nr:unnamed protein product [Soboliphyme baturini]